MTKNYPLASTVVDLCDTFDDLLESLSALQLLAELPVFDLSEAQLLREALRILHRSCHASSCTVFLLAPHTDSDQFNAALGNIMAVDANEILHLRQPSALEELFIRATIRENTLQHCDDCTSLGSEFHHPHCEISVISVPLRVKTQLAGVMTLAQHKAQHSNPLGHRLLQLYSTFLGQQLASCRLSCECSTLNENCPP